MSDKSKKSKKFPHDASYKDFFSHPAMVASLLRDFVHEPFVREMDLDTLERLSGEFVGKGFVKGVSDTVWRARWRERAWCYVALLLEFQSKPDPLMPFRLTGYTTQLLLRLAKEDKSLRAGRFPAVLPIVWYTGDTPWNAPPDTLGMFETALSERLHVYLPKQEYVLIDLCRLDAGRAELRDSLTALVARFRQAKTFEEMRHVLADMARVLRRHPELQRVFVDFTALRLHHSGVPGNWEQELNNIEEVYDMLSIDVARWGEGFRAQGRAEGALMTQRETLREVLKNFADPLPRWLADWLEKETDLQRLRSLTIAAFRIKTMAEFAALVEREQDGAAS